ncbi:MAG: hypothetical protein AB1726_17805 [Planctomycetota bacterium]
MLEVTLCLLVVTTVLLGATRAFSASLAAMAQARDVTRGALFLETALEDVGTQPYGSLLALNGDRIFDRPDAADSRFAVDLTAFLAEVDLIQVRAVLVDLRTDREVGRVTTLRSAR